MSTPDQRRATLTQLMDQGAVGPGRLSLVGVLAAGAQLYAPVDRAGCDAAD